MFLLPTLVGGRGAGWVFKGKELVGTPWFSRETNKINPPLWGTNNKDTPPRVPTAQLEDEPPIWALGSGRGLAPPVVPNPESFTLASRPAGRKVCCGGCMS